MNDSNELFTHFQTEGYCILENFIEPHVVAGLQFEVELMVEELAQRRLIEHKITDSYEAEPFTTRLIHLFADHLDEAPSLYRSQLHREGFYGLFFYPRLLDLVEKLLGSELLLYPNYSLRPKLPEFEAARVLWHQDGGYTPGGDVTKLRMVNLWTPLVPVNVENGCMQFIPKTHNLGVVPHEKKEFYLEIAEAYLLPRLQEVINVEVNPGDLVLFNNLLFHQGLPNKSNHVRWSLDWRYLDATQSTLRKEKGFVARSAIHPENEVHSKEEWAQLSFS